MPRMTGNRYFAEAVHAYGISHVFFVPTIMLPAMAAKQDAMLREQIAIAERYPDLRACLTDNVVFLAGGSRVVPMSSLSRGFTLEQADAVVAQLRNG